MQGVIKTCFTALLTLQQLLLHHRPLLCQDCVLSHAPIWLPLTQLVGVMQFPLEGCPLFGASTACMLSHWTMQGFWLHWPIQFQFELHIITMIRLCWCWQELQQFQCCFSYQLPLCDYAPCHWGCSSECDCLNYRIGTPGTNPFTLTWGSPIRLALFLCHVHHVQLHTVLSLGVQQPFAICRHATAWTSGTLRIGGL